MLARRRQAVQVAVAERFSESSAPVTGVSRLLLRPRLQRAIPIALVVLSLLTLVFVTLLLLRSRATSGLSAGAGTGVLLFLLGVLVGGIGILAAIRLLEARDERARRAQYLARGRERVEGGQESGHEPQTIARKDPGKVRGVETILLVDLIQSTELIAKHGDVLFRDLLRRIETAFIPVARECRTLHVDGHGDGLLFCFDHPEQALAALRGMYARVPAINKLMPPGVEVAFRGSLHVGETIIDTRGNRTGLAVLKTARLGSAMESLHGRGAGRNSLVISAEALSPLVAAGAAVTPLGEVALRGFPGTHAVYQVEV